MFKQSKGDNNNLKVYDKKRRERLLSSSRLLGTAYSAWETNWTLRLLTFRGLCLGNGCCVHFRDKRLKIVCFVCLSQAESGTLWGRLTSSQSLPSHFDNAACI